MLPVWMPVRILNDRVVAFVKKWIDLPSILQNRYRPGHRSSTLLTEDGAEVIIPNGDVLSHNIVNWTLGNNHIRIALSFMIDRPAHSEWYRIGGHRRNHKEQLQCFGTPGAGYNNE
jgi:hypothetical protein